MSPQSGEGAAGAADGVADPDDVEVVDLEALIAEPRPLRSPRPARRRTPRTPRPPASRRTWVLLLGIPLAVLAVWGLLAYLTARDLQGDLLGARQQLVEGRDAFLGGDVDRAEDAFDRAARTLAAAPDRLGSPLLAPVRLVPVLRRSTDVAADLAEAAARVARAGQSIAAELAGQEGGLDALTPREGRLPVDALADLAPVLGEAAEELAAAADRVAALPDRGIHGSVAEARAEFLALIEPAVAQADTAARLAEELPGFFGADGPRRYMVAASNPTEARGTGGYLGAFTVMTIDRGELAFGPVEALRDLENLPPDELPWPDESLEARYGDYGGSGFWQNLNMTPDFPSAATMIEQLYEAVEGRPLDGVIAVDPYAFEELIRLSGPVELPVVGEVDADGVVDFVAHDAYAVITDPDERQRLIGEVATAALRTFLGDAGSAGPRELVDAVARMAANGSLRIHTTDPDVQRLWADLGVDGALDAAPGDAMGVFTNSATASKIDWFLDRTVRYDVVLDADGTATSTLTLGLANSAPTTGEPSYVIGPNAPGLDAGDNLMLVSAYCAPGCVFHDWPDEGAFDLPTDVGTELGFGVASTWTHIPSLQSRQLIWTWTTPDAWTREGGEGRYRLSYLHQTTIRPPRVEVAVTLPEGAELIDTGPDGRVVGTQVEATFDATSDRILEISFSPPPG